MLHYFHSFSYKLIGFILSALILLPLTFIARDISLLFDISLITQFSFGELMGIILTIRVAILTTGLSRKNIHEEHVNKERYKFKPKDILFYDTIRSLIFLKLMIIIWLKAYFIYGLLLLL